MLFLKDTFCQICERFITKEDWNNHFYSSGHFYSEAHGYWPVCFPQRKLVKDEKNIFEKAFCKIFFATSDIEEVEEFWLTYFMMTTKMGDVSQKKMGRGCEKFLEILSGVNLNTI